MAEPPARRLVTMRHARAEQAGPTDLERQLTRSGEQDAAEAGAWLREAGVVPDAALVSAASRAVGTWTAMARAAGWIVEPLVDRGLYTAGPEAALDLIRETTDEVATLVVVGHNPTIATLAQLLDDGDGDPEAGTQMVLDFPAGALAMFEYDGGWGELDWSTARVTGYHVGRG